VFFVLFVFVLCLLYPMFPVSLDWPFFITPSVFSNVYFKFWAINQDNSMPNRKFTSCYNIKILNRLWEKYMLFSLNFAWKGQFCSP
jgi:hypothetical protein